MILQTIAWPDRAEDRELFFRSEASLEIDPRAGAFRLERQSARFDTYFNSFSLKKWKQYTRLDGVALRLELKGRAEIALLRHDLEGEIEARPAAWDQPDFRAVTREVFRQAYDCDDYRTLELAFPDCGGADAVSFCAYAPEGAAVVRGAAYVAAGDTPEPDEVNLALVICTYKREAYIDASIGMLRREVFDNPRSPLRDHLRVYIADNGQSLGEDRFAGLPVNIYANPNSGGAGGFSRAAIEAVNDPDYPVTHVVLMDDDISFNAWSLERNRSFVSLIREEHRLHLLGGAMLNADHRNQLYACGDTLTLEFVVNISV